MLDLEEATKAVKALHSAICTERPGVCAWKDRSFALTSETVNVKGKPVEIYNVARLDSSGPAAASRAVQAGDYERQQRDFSLSCTSCAYLSEQRRREEQERQQWEQHQRRQQEEQSVSSGSKI